MHTTHEIIPTLAYVSPAKDGGVSLFLEEEDDTTIKAGLSRAQAISLYRSLDRLLDKGAQEES